MHEHGYVTGVRSLVTDDSLSSPLSDGGDAGLLALDSHQVYNSSAGQLITVISPAAAAAALSISQSQ